MRSFLTWAAAGCVLAALAGPALAQFPVRAVTLTVPLPQGDIAHTAARLIAAKLTERWGRAVFADARPASAGATAIAEVARAKPDGHTLLVGTLATQVIGPLVQPPAAAEAQAALAPATLLIEVPMVLLVDPATKARSLRELATAKPKAPPLRSTSAGGANPAHVAALLFESVARIPLEHEAAEDDRAALKMLAGGNAAVAFVPVHEALEHVRSGKARALAVTSAQRSPALPKLQTVAESGFAGYEISCWAGLFAPAGTPAATLEQIARDASQAVGASDVRHALEQRGVLAIGSDPQQFRRRIERDRARHAPLLKEKGLARG